MQESVSCWSSGCWGVPAGVDEVEALGVELSPEL